MSRKEGAVARRLAAAPRSICSAGRPSIARRSALDKPLAAAGRSPPRMLLRDRTGETFYLGPALRLRREEAREALAQMLESAGGGARLKRALEADVAAGKADAMSDGELVEKLAE